MINESLQSFVTCDVEFAMRVVSLDGVVDDLYDQVFRELLTFMMVDSKTTNRATRLIWVAHNLEHAADRATNICERVVFTVTGKNGGNRDFEILGKDQGERLSAQFRIHPIIQPIFF